MPTQRADINWQVAFIQPRFPWSSGPIRPADVIQKLRDVMFQKQNLIEDANYHKIIPNRYVIELSEGNYGRNYLPIEARVLQQWREKLLEFLTTANSRQGRREYSFAGPVQVEIRPAPDLNDMQARILSAFDSRAQKEPAVPMDLLPGCLELIPTGKKWRLHRGINTVGREPENDVYLDMPEVQERRLVSGQHAYLRCNEGQYLLFDGSPSGKPSVNGTYVNNRQVPANGYPLQDGDRVLLAALDPQNPSPNTPGVVVLHFSLEGKS